MPKCVSYEPKTLFNICVDYAAVNIDDILKYEEQWKKQDPLPEVMKFQDLPVTLFQIVSDKIISVDALHGGNYRKILNDRTRIICLNWNWVDTDIHMRLEFLEFLQEHCKGIAKINFGPLLGDGHNIHWDVEIGTRSTLVGQAISSLVHLEWINLFNCDINDECLKCIGSTCVNLKYLNIIFCSDVTEEGIRALCDSEMVPYGKCTKLTNLVTSEELQRPPISPEIISLLFLNCPDLDKLIGRSVVKGLATAIAAMDSSALAEMSSSDEAHPSELSNRIAATSLSSKPLMQRVFKLKYLHYNWDNELIPNVSFFKALSKYCPFLEELFLYHPKVTAGDLLGLFCLPLKWLQVDAKHKQPMCFELLLLLRSVGSSLTTLQLSSYSMFDLRVIRRECPNLTRLHLRLCDTTNGSATWPDYPVNELKDCVFSSLTYLNLTKTMISIENFADLLSSPNIDFISIHEDRTGERNSLYAIQQALSRFPKAFCKLQRLELFYVEMSKLALSALLERAIGLKTLIISSCFCRQDGAVIPFDEQTYLDDLIRANNWDLEYDWQAGIEFRFYEGDVVYRLM